MADYTKPIINYKPPKSDSPETIEWLANWLNNRRAQLYNNLGGLFTWSGYHPDTYNIQQRKWAEPWFNRRTYVNKNFYSQIENAASAKLYKHTLDDWNGGLALGYYSPQKHEVHVRQPVFEGEETGNPEIHEYTHAMRAKPQQSAIRDILSNSKIKIDNSEYDESDINYLLDSGEIYSRMMEFRYKTKMKPSQVVDQKFLNQHRQQIKDFRLDMFEDKDLMRLFNEVAYQPNENNNIPMAKKGSTVKRREDIEQSLSEEYPYLYDQYPAYIIQDNSFNSGKGDIETMLGEDAYYPETNYTYKNPFAGENTIVFNDKIKNPKTAAKLDYLHVLRKKDPIYQKLLQDLHKSFVNSDVINTAKQRYKEDKKNNNGKEVMPFSRYVENEEDGWLRNMLHPGTAKEMEEDNYYPDKAQLMNWNRALINPTKQIYSYLYPTELPELIVTDKNK